jgi:hypothetical protein
MWDDVHILTLEQAKTQVRITHTYEDDDMAVKLELAHGIVLDYIYLSREADEDLLETMQAWSETTAPAGVKAAIARMFANLVEFRGDNPDMDIDGNDLPRDVRQLLRMYKDPVIA